MAVAKNKVISGLYSGKRIVIKSFIRQKDKQFTRLKYLAIQADFTDFIIINEQNIKSIEIINQEGVQTDTGSSIARGIAGGLLLGGAGIIAGASMGKQNSINLLQINWNDGQKSLVEVNYNILSMLNTICWNIKNNIDGDKLTNKEIQEQTKQRNVQTKGCLVTCLKVFLVIIILLLSTLCPYLLIILGVWIILKFYKQESNKKEEMENND